MPRVVSTADRAPSHLHLRVGVVGAGRVGSVLAAALAAGGFPVVAATAVSAASRARAASLLPGALLLPADDVARACDLLLLAVPDDALAGLAAGLVATGSVRPGLVVVHVSGRHGRDVLAPMAAVGARTLALHPAMTFQGVAADLDRLPGTRVAISAGPDDRGLAEELTKALGCIAVPVEDSQRVRYHAALAHGANHLVTLVGQAADELRAAGVADPAGVLRPLLSAALDGALEQGDAALTGPVSRGDSQTVEAHLAALDRRTRDTYVALARATAQRALAAGRLRADQAELLDAVLVDPVQVLDLTGLRP